MPYLQQQHPYHFQPPAPTKLLTPVVMVLMALVLAGSCLTFWFKEDFLDYFALNHPQVMGWKIWQFFTYSFISLGWISLMIELVVLLLFGSAVERLHKSRNLAVFFILVIPLFGLIMLPVLMFFERIPFIVGPDVLFNGILGMFAYCHRKQRMMMYLWVVEADKAAWLMVAINAMLMIFMPYRLIFVAAAPIGWFYMKWFKGGGIIPGRKSAGDSRKPTGRNQEGFVDID